MVRPPASVSRRPGRASARQGPRPLGREPGKSSPPGGHVVSWAAQRPGERAARPFGYRSRHRPTQDPCMLTAAQVIAFLLAAVLLTATPGPDNLMVLGVGMSKGRK